MVIEFHELVWRPLVDGGDEIGEEEHGSVGADLFELAG